MNYIIIDQGTSSTKSFLINTNGRILYSNKAKYDLQRPRPFHIECDPETILNANVPPAPTVAVTTAPVPPPPP